MLDFGWKVNEERDGAWIDDPALIGVTDAAKADWRKDGAAAHLLPFVKNGTLTIIKFRALNADEVRFVRRHAADGMAPPMENVILDCFAMGARLPSMAEAGKTGAGETLETMTRDASGFHRISIPTLNAIDQRYPGLISFFGTRIFEASFASEPEKKASSPGSTGPQSAAEAGTGPSTEDGQSAKAQAV